MCLLFLLCELREKYEITLKAVHIQHGIRGTEAERDAEFVRDTCKKLQVPFHLVEENVPAYAEERKLSLEEAGRQVRYESLLREAADKVAVAHHAEDQAETVLFNLIRGSGPRGLAGISPVNGRVIRPLLCADRGEIERYLTERKISWRTDSTNTDLYYARNRIRHRILPEAEQINTGAVRHICEAAEQIREEELYLDEKVKELWGRYVEETDGTALKLNGEAFSESRVLLTRLIRSMAERLNGSLKDLTREHVRQVLELREKTSGRRILLPGGLTAQTDFGAIELRRQADSTGREAAEKEGIPVEVLLGKGSGLLPDGRIVKASLMPADAVKIRNLTYTKWFDYDKIKSAAVFRTRREGDRIAIRGGTKKLKDVFIEERIPRDKRDGLYLLAAGKEVLWIPGSRYSEKYKVTGETKRILEIKMEEG